MYVIQNTDPERTTEQAEAAHALHAELNLATYQFAELISFDNGTSDIPATNHNPIESVNKLFNDAYLYSHIDSTFFDRVQLAITNGEVLNSEHDGLVIDISDDDPPTKLETPDELFNFSRFYHCRAYQILRPDVFEKISGRLFKTPFELENFLAARDLYFSNRENEIEKNKNKKKKTEKVNTIEKKVEDEKNKRSAGRPKVELTPEEEKLKKQADAIKTDKENEKINNRLAKAKKNAQIEMIRYELQQARLMKKSVLAEWDLYILRINERLKLKRAE